MERVRQCRPATIIQSKSIQPFMHTQHHDYPTVHMPQVPTRRLLENQTAIVTGASSGIGKSIAIALGAAGANVCVNYVTGPEKAEVVVEEIEKDGAHAFAQQADVSSEAEVVAMFEATRAEFGSVDILVNNAGLQVDAPFAEIYPGTMAKGHRRELNRSIPLRSRSGQGVQASRSATGGLVRRRKDHLHQLRPRGDPLGRSRELCGIEGRRNADDEKYRTGSRALADSRQFDRAGRDSHADQHGGMGYTGTLLPTTKVNSL
jgi:short chain dehydrogenase